MIYHSLHIPLPCVRAAVLKSGTFELYRDLLWPGGIHNFAVGAGVLGLISAPAVAQGGDRLQRNPGSAVDTAAGLNDAGMSAFTHTTLDDWWRERSFRGDVNDLPILMIDGFFDVESRGAFQAYQELRDDGAHLVVVGAHDGAPAGTDGGTGEAAAWFDRYLRGVENGVESHPRVQLWLADGDREDALAGKFVRYDASDWPVPGTRWESLALDPARSGTAKSINDGSLSRDRPGTDRHAGLPDGPVAAERQRPAEHGDRRRRRAQRAGERLPGDDGHDARRAARPVLHDGAVRHRCALGRPGQPRAAPGQHGARDRHLGRALGCGAQRHAASGGERTPLERLSRDRRARDRCTTRRPARSSSPTGSTTRRRPAAPGRRAPVPRRVLADRQPLQARPPPAPAHPRHLGRIAPRRAGRQHRPRRRPATASRLRFPVLP